MLRAGMARGRKEGRGVGAVGHMCRVMVLKS